MTAAPARMYDYYLGGKDKFAADREAAEAVLATAPEARAAAAANRSFLVQTVRHLAAQGIDQFIDIGVGIPTSPNVHEVALGIHPSARVVYADNDPIVIAHTRALRAVDGSVIGIEGDLRQPHEILTHPDVRQLINFNRPVAVLLIAVVHFVTDAEDPRSITDVLRAATAPGSALVISHATASPDTWARAEQAAARYTDHHATSPMVLRTPEAIADLIAGDGWTLDGLAPVTSWPTLTAVTGPTIVGGIAHHT